MKKIRKNNTQFNTKQFAEDYQFYVDCAPYCKFLTLQKKLLTTINYNERLGNSTQARKSHLEITKKHLQKFNIYTSKIFLDVLLKNKCKTDYLDLIESKKIFQQILGIKKYYGYKGIDKSIIYLVFEIYFEHW